MKNCTILFSNKIIIISSAVDTPEGEIKWGKPLIKLKSDADAAYIGRAVIENLNSTIQAVAQPEEILYETGFKSWGEFSKNNMLLTAELKTDKIIIHPFFSGIDGEYYAVLNRDLISSQDPYELGHSVLKSLDYCK